MTSKKPVKPMSKRQISETVSHYQKLKEQLDYVVFHVYLPVSVYMRDIQLASMIYKNGKVVTTYSIATSCPYNTETRSFAVDTNWLTLPAKELLKLRRRLLEREEANRRRRERREEAACANKQEAAERKEYERLKKKYG